jgi:hypothetical protein
MEKQTIVTLVKSFVFGAVLSVVGGALANGVEVFADPGVCDTDVCKDGGCPGGETKCCSVEVGGQKVTCYLTPKIE